MNIAKGIQSDKKNDSSETFEKMLAFEQNKGNRPKTLEEIPVEVDSGVMAGKMNYYNNRAMESYFCMTFSTTDLRA